MEKGTGIKESSDGPICSRFCAFGLALQSENINPVFKDIISDGKLDDEVSILDFTYLPI